MKHTDTPKTAKSARLVRYAFDSVAEFARHLENAPPTWKARQSSKTRAENSWDLKAGYNGAWDMARYGWPEGAKRAQSALKQLRVKTPAPDQKPDFYGHRPHVPRFCAGAPDSMIRHAPALSDKTGAVVTLYVPINAPCMTRAANMANFGVALAQYVNQMQREGVRVELWAGCANHFDDMRLAYSVRVKRADQPLDLAVLAFAIGHPAMFRRLGFAMLERSEAREDPSYGYSRDFALSDAINPPRGAYVVNGMKDANEIARTPEDALKYISAQLDKAMNAKKTPAK